MIGKYLTTKTINLIYGISDRDIEALQILSSTDKPTKSQIKLVQEFLKAKEGNMVFNRQLGEIPKSLLEAAKISPQCIADVKYFSFKTRHYKRNEQKFSEALGKLGRNFDKSENDKEAVEGDKISLADYGLINDISKLNLIMTSLKDKGVLEGDKHLNRLCEECQKSKEIMDGIEDNFQKQFKLDSGSGGIVLTKAPNIENPKPFWKRSLGESLGEAFRKLKQYFTKHGHAAKLYDSQGKLTIDITFQNGTKIG